ncbi:MAG: tetratricopeptide (TPR) repeat protein [Verrucomicrobiales bacterium]|jgi:tetratricopeptide (TPR) repeat protein
MARFLWSLFALSLLGSPTHVFADSKEDAAVLESLGRALEARPDDVKARINRGMYYLWRTFEYENALADFNRVLELEPENVTAYIARADVYTGWDARFYDPKKAKADADKAVSLAPKLSDAFRIRGDLPGHPGMGEPEDSLRDYKRAIELDADNLLAQVGLAYTYSKKDTAFHDQKKAFEHARNALQIGPNESIALEAFGDLLAGEAETRNDGLAMLNRALELNPRSVGTYLARGYTYLVWSMEEEWPVLLGLLQNDGLTVLDSIRGNSKAFEKALKGLGENSRLTLALNDFDQAEKLCPNNDDVFSARAYALQSFPGQERRALESYTQAARLNPHDASVLVDRAEFLMANPQLMIDPASVANRGDQEDLDGAALGEMIARRFPIVSEELEADLGKALALEKDARTYFLRGSLRGSALENYPGAISDLSAALEEAPLNSSYLEARAAVHEAFGHEEEAEKDRAKISDLEEMD